VTPSERASRICGKCKNRKVEPLRGRGARKVYICILDDLSVRYRTGAKATCHQSWINCYQPIEDAPNQEEERDNAPQ